MALGAWSNGCEMVRMCVAVAFWRDRWNVSRTGPERREWLITWRVCVEGSWAIPRGWKSCVEAGKLRREIGVVVWVVA